MLIDNGWRLSVNAYHITESMQQKVLVLTQRPLLSETILIYKIHIASTSIQTVQ